jgi:hypothetical protein
MLVGVCAATASARYSRENGNGPLEARRWGLLVGAGVAPGFFKNRGFDQTVWPASGVNCPVNNITGGNLTCDQIYRVLNNPLNVFQQSACKLPKFNKLFTNGVVHVTGQISYNVCCNTQFFLEGVYNRARGSNCLNITSNNYAAPAYCQSNGNCSTNCSTSSCNTGCNTSCSTSSSCSVTGTPLTTSQPTSYCYSNYQAYGGYLGTRYYWNRVWCDRFSFFGGFKFGMLHRKQICATASYPAYTASLSGSQTVYNFPAASNTYIAFCKSNAVSGGLQLGLDYCINHCWSFLLGVEIVATSPFKSNRNVPLTVVDPTGTAAGFGSNFAQPTNLLVAPTGTLLQFPVWAGFRWEFDWCKNSCNEC